MWSEEWPIVKRGSWLYDGTRRSQIRIQQGDVLFGSGDHADPPEYREDREVTCFYVWYESPPGSESYPAGGGGFLSLDDAMDNVQRICGNTVQWDSGKQNTQRAITKSQFLCIFANSFSIIGAFENSVDRWQ